MNRKARRLEGIEGSTLAGKEQVWWEILVWLCVFSFLWSSVIFSLYNILVGLFGTILTVFFFCWSVWTNPLLQTVHECRIVVCKPEGEVTCYT